MKKNRYFKVIILDLPHFLSNCPIKADFTGFLTIIMIDDYL